MQNQSSHIIVFNTITNILLMKGGENKLTSLDIIQQHLPIVLSEIELINILSLMIRDKIIGYWTPSGGKRYYRISKDAWAKVNAIFGETFNQTTASRETA